MKIVYEVYGSKKMTGEWRLEDEATTEVDSRHLSRDLSRLVSAALSVHDVDKVRIKWGRTGMAGGSWNWFG